VAALAAIASQETAFVLPAVWVHTVALYVPETGARRRALRAGMALVPHAAIVVMLLALRAALGLVGVEALAPPSVAAAGAPLLATSAAGRFALVSLAAVVLVALALALFAWSWRGRRELDEALDVRAEIVPLALALAVLALTHGRSSPWKLEYMYLIPIAATALLGAGLVDRAWRFGRARGALGWVAAAMMVLLALGPAAWLVRFSPFVFHYGEGRRATEFSRTFFDQARARIEAAPVGSVVPGPPLPQRIPPADPLRVTGTAILHDYSVQAWVDLTWPERRIRVVSTIGHDAPVPPVPAPGETVLHLRTVRSRGI
jgi:hypothetical protein